MKINNAVVFVTGANRGLGRALVLAALERSARRVYAAARDVRALAPLVAHAPGKIIPLALDINDPHSLAAAAEQAPDVGVLVNNAGVLASFSVLTSTPEQITQDFATNVFGTLAATRAFLPALERAGAATQAAVINVLSVVSLANMPGLGGYSAAKAASYSITQALRAELRSKRISVHGVLAGAIDTDMVRAMEMPKSSPELVANGIFDGVEQEVEDILPDPMSRDLFAIWKRDPKELERQLAGMAG